MDVRRVTFEDSWMTKEWILREKWLLATKVGEKERGRN